jgi:cytochrome c-type protein NapB
MYRFLVLVFIVALVSCSRGDDEKTIEKEYFDEDELGIINASVFDDNTLEMSYSEFNVIEPGESQLLGRSFENAPPMIPHKTEGFFPITFANNICLSCHLPDIAPLKGAVPLPETHFTSLRPQIETDGDVYYSVDDSRIVKMVTPGNLSNAYFSCNQCHVPQTDISVDIENLFTPEFRKLLNKSRSSLDDQVTEGVN